MIFYSKREEEIYTETLEAITGKKNAADLNLIKAFAVEMATYEEACAKLAKKKTTTRGTGGEMPSPWIAIRNQAITNAQRIMKLLNMSELAKQEQPVAKVAKLDLLKNGKKNIIQKAAN
jgi:phage terminase small subunit